MSEQEQMEEIMKMLGMEPKSKKSDATEKEPVVEGTAVEVPVTEETTVNNPWAQEAKPWPFEQDETEVSSVEAPATEESKVNNPWAQEAKPWPFEQEQTEEEEKTELEGDEKEVKEDTPNLEGLSDKSKKLIEKVDKLCEKIKEEKNPVKLHMLTFKVRMLQSKIQRELDLQNLKENYQLKRDELKKGKDARDIDEIEAIDNLSKKIKLKEQEIESNSDVDIDSPDCIYSRKAIESKGGVQGFCDFIKKNGKDDVKITAQRMEHTEQLKQELEELQNQLEEQQGLLENSEAQYNKDKRGLAIEETRMTIAKKNPFLRVGDFFKAVGAGIADIRANIVAVKAENDKYKADKKAKQEAHKAEMKALKEAAKEAKTNATKNLFKESIHVDQAQQTQEPVAQETTAPEQTVEAPAQDDKGMEPGE